MRRQGVVQLGLLGLSLWAGGASITPQARAASFDCAKAKAAIEVLICTTPALNALDDRLKLALDAAVKQAGDGRAALLTDHRRWLAETPGACGLIRPPAGDPVLACLTQAYEKQIAALKAATAPQPSAPPSPPHPGPAVAVDPAQLPATGRQTSYLSLDTPAWVTVKTESATGVALKLVDMIAGPLGEAGEAGQRDGRIDTLLDRGRYKLILTGADKADGQVTVTARSATEVHAPALPLAQAPGETLATTLEDGQQRSYWVTVGADPVAILATGRALADLRLWRDGTELAPLTPETRVTDAAPGRPQRVLTLAGSLPPGRYKLTLYGGAPLRWTEDATEMPAALRLAPQRLTTLEYRTGTIGPTGIEQAIVPATVDYARVELPSVAPVRLAARGLSSPRGTGFAEITRLNRRPIAAMGFAADAKGTLITLEGAPGQAFTLTSFPRVTTEETRLPSAKAAHLVTLLDAAPGSGGFPLTAYVGDYDKLLASAALRLGSTDGVRSSLTLDGRETLYVQITEAGRYRLKTQGVPHFWSLYPAGSYEAVPNSPSGAFDLDAGLYRLSLRPSSAKTGPVEVILTGEAATDTPAAPPARRLLSMLVPEPPNASYNYPLIMVPERASAPSGMAVYPLPLKLTAAAPVLLGLAPDQSFDLPLAPATAGTLSVNDEAGKPLPFQLDGKPATGKAALTAGAHKLTVRNVDSAPRGLRITLETRAAAPSPPSGGAEPPAPAYPRLTAGQTYALDLSGTDPRRFDLLVEEAGLYRIETQGRLAVQAGIRTLLLPHLARAAENGPGHNAVLEPYLRAGRYQVDLTPLRKTQGRVGLSLSRAPLAESPPLRIDMPARVALARGAGAILPFTVAKRGPYDLQVLSLADPIAFRLEDADGWPLLPLSQETEPFGAAGRLLTVALEAGDYRLVLLPTALPARAVVRLTSPTETPRVPQGHGPHPLTLNTAQEFRWLEPAQPDAPRTPDQWDFALPGPTRLTLTLTEGMVGDLLFEDGGTYQSVGQISAARPFTATVAGGRYRLAVTALARNNRLGYRLTSATEEILPDQPRRVPLPTRQSFSLATPQTIRLTSYGTQDVRATLRDAEGRIVAEADDRLNDWNFVLVRALPAGRYTLSVDPVTPPPAGVDPATAPEENSSADPETADEEETADATPEMPDAAPALDPSLSPLAHLAAGAVELTLSPLPETPLAPLALTSGQSHSIPVGGAQTLLPLTLGPTALRIDAAPGPELLLSLERQAAADGPWETLDQASGSAPSLALLPAAGGAYRLRIVALSGGDTPGHRVTLRALDLPTQAMGDGLRFTALDGLPLAVARLRVPGAPALDLGPLPSGLTALSGADGIAHPVPASVLLLAGEDLWLFRPSPETMPLAIKPLTLAGDEPLVLRPTGPVTLTAGAVPEGKVTLWHAQAPQGQPLLALGGSAGLSPGSALATGPAAQVRLTALGSQPMPLVTLTRHLLDKPIQMDGKAAALSPPLPARGSLDLTLASGPKRLTLDLPAGVAAELDGLPLMGRTGAPTAYQLETKADRLRLYNLGTAQAQAALRQLPAPDLRLTVTAQQSFKRFLPAAGTLLLAVPATPGQTLRIEGAPAVWQGADGRVLRGSRLPVTGPGVLTLDHTAGLVAVWLDGPGASLWPDTTAQTLTLPKSLPLSGPAQAFKLTLAEPGLLHIRSTAPAIAGLRSGEGAESVRLFPTGADWYRYLPPGPVDLHLAAAQDGGLSGSLDLTVSPVTPVQDGLSAPVPLAAGESRAFAFTVPRAGKIGVGVKALRDPAAVRLLDAKGTLIGTGLVQYRSLPPGAYVLEVEAPADAALTVQAAVVGIALPDRGPPPDVRQAYLDLVGLRPTAP